MADGIGERIAQLRGPRSQTKIARMAGINVSTYNRIERGKNRNPSQNTLEKIARALRVPVTSLLEPPPQPLPEDLRLVLVSLREGLDQVKLMALGAQSVAEAAQVSVAAALSDLRSAHEAARNAEAKAEQALRLAARRGRRTL